MISKDRGFNNKIMELVVIIRLHSKELKPFFSRNYIIVFFTRPPSTRKSIFANEPLNRSHEKINIFSRADLLKHPNVKIPVSLHVLFSPPPSLPH